MNEKMVSAFFHTLAATYPRGIYCVVFQAGGCDDLPSLSTCETSGITPIECPMCESLMESGFDIQKHFERAIPQMEIIFKKAFENAFKEYFEKRGGDT